MQKKNKRRIRSVLPIYLNMTAALASVVVLFVIFLYYFQQMRIRENPKYALPKPLLLTALVFSVILFLSLIGLLCFSYLHFSNVRKRREKIEEENKEAIENMKKELACKPLSTKQEIDTRYTLKQEMSLSAIQKSMSLLYSPFFLLLAFCTMVVFVVVFSVSFLIGNPILMAIFAIYLVIPILGFVTFRFLIPKHEMKKGTTEKEYVFLDDHVCVRDDHNYQEQFFYREIEKSKKTRDGICLVYRNTNGKKAGAFIPVDEDKSPKLYEFLSLKILQREGFTDL